MSECPYCAEEIPAESAKCPACGEHLGDEREVTAKQGKSTLAIVLIVLGLVAVLFFCVFVGFGAFAFSSRRTTVVLPPPGVASQAPPLKQAPIADPRLPTTHPLNLDGSLDPVGEEAAFRIYAQGGFVFFDVANARLAIRGATLPGSLGATLPLSPSAFDSGAGSVGAGNLQFTYRTSGGVTRCDLHGVRFTIEGGLLKVGAVAIPVTGPRQVLTIDRDGQNAVSEPYAGP